MVSKRLAVRRSNLERRKFEYAIVIPNRRNTKYDRRIFDRRDLKFEKE